jgi:DNA-binding transcriptional LysR family regulator
MDRLESMSILVTAVEVGSLSAAGRRLGAPLATVSRKISELEAHLKTRLLNRSSRRLSLTDATSLRRGVQVHPRGSGGSRARRVGRI